MKKVHIKKIKPLRSGDPGTGGGGVGCPPVNPIN